MRFVTENPNAYRERLLKAKSAVLERLSELDEPMKAQMERHELEKINSALERIERGEYGKCLSCGADIDRHRLDTLPTASQCIGCAQDNH